MSGRKPPLQKLVALKRQRAEQVLLSIQQELNGLIAELGRLEADLATMDGQGGGIESHLLAYEHGFDQRQIHAIAQCRARIVEKEEAYFAAREALKRAFDSEERLRRGDGGG